jgi:hypothetical protein
MSEFAIPPLSTLLGSTLPNYIRVLRQGKIEKRYFFKIALTGIIVIIATPFHIYEYFTFRRKISRFKFDMEPLFILGHWRSGTTLLHNVLTKDPSTAYLTTYHSVFPNNLKSKWLFKTLMRINMPESRPADNVKLNVDYPQEDEFAFCNSQHNSYYNFFYFPLYYDTFYEKAVRLKGLTNKEIKLWYNSYDKLLKKAILDTKGERVVIKNPVNTGRIRHLLKLYPNAKFIYLYRNPVTVFYSTQRFFQELFPTLWFQKVSHRHIDDLIIDIYKRLIHDYQIEKQLIPADNLMEIKFEDLEEQPIEVLRKIYHELLKEDFKSVKTIFENYLHSQHMYKKNNYRVNAKSLEKVQSQWKWFIELYKYELPNNLES